MATNPNLLMKLIRCNQGILQQKLSLLSVLESKYGIQELSQTLFQKKCPIAHASIGQHYRHSMDHMELAVLVAATRNEMADIGVDMDPITLRYDYRVRGGTLEKDLQESRKRMQSVHQILEEINCSHAPPDRNDNDAMDIMDASVNASFMLSSDASGAEAEMDLPSTIGRELGFAAHHAIHHLAMVKIIAVQTLGLQENEFPKDFGMAPSTVRFEEHENAAIKP
mmetsp:Transcript_22642/g.33507  ORF Transcript_22642/g.33507 Transcript_22642/m.33507 type:complete len:224 (+) Transcript_22642:66-737(+)